MTSDFIFSFILLVSLRTSSPDNDHEQYAAQPDKPGNQGPHRERPALLRAQLQAARDDLESRQGLAPVGYRRQGLYRSGLGYRGQPLRPSGCGFGGGGGVATEKTLAHQQYL